MYFSSLYTRRVYNVMMISNPTPSKLHQEQNRTEDGTMPSWSQRHPEYPRKNRRNHDRHRDQMIANRLIDVLSVFFCAGLST